MSVFSVSVFLLPPQAVEFAPTPSHKTAKEEQAGLRRDRGIVITATAYFLKRELTN